MECSGFWAALQSLYIYTRIKIIKLGNEFLRRGVLEFVCYLCILHKLNTSFRQICDR
jgi:hypothetical protein